MRMAWAAAGALAAFTYLWRLGVPSWHRDEWAYANAGYRYIGGGAPVNLEHPPLAKLLMGVSEHVLGFSTTSARLPAVAAALVTGIMLALIARRIAGEPAALLTFVLWVVLPHPWGDLRVDRLGLLDTFAGAFATVALWLALRIREKPVRRDALLLGVAIGCAAACKATGLLCVVPVAILLWPRLRTLALAVAVAPVVFVATYIPLRTNPVDAIRFMWDEQRNLSRIGFPLEVAGHVYQHPPWWSAAWFAWEAGPLVLVATLVLAVLGLLRVERRVALALGVAVLLPMLAVTTHGRFFEHYGYTWAPPLTLLAGLGATRLRALPATAILLGAGAISVFGIATLERADYALAGDALKTTAAHTIYVAGAPTSLAGYVCPGVLLTSEELKNGAIPDAVVIDRRTAAARTYPRRIGAGYSERRFGPVTLLTRPGLAPRDGC
jgi:4-amino-4-deoxy-L-arabinose transferase-like glycosyltransferase